MRYHQGFSAAQDCLGCCFIRLPFFSHVLEGSDYFLTDGKPWYYSCDVTFSDIRNTRVMEPWRFLPRFQRKTLEECCQGQHLFRQTLREKCKVKVYT